MGAAPEGSSFVSPHVEVRSADDCGKSTLRKIYDLDRVSTPRASLIVRHPGERGRDGDVIQSYLTLFLLADGVSPYDSR